MNVNGKWCIQAQLLHELLTYGDGSQTLLEIGGNWSGGRGFPVVKGILTWLVMQALHIERLPWMPDTPMTFVPEHKKLRSALLTLAQSPREITAACNEIVALHQHTQTHFSTRGVTTVRLGRGYKNDDFGKNLAGGYATAVLRLAEAARLLGKQRITIPHDIITSWARSDSYTGCVAGVTMDIPVEDIFCGADILQPRPNAVGTFAMESGEWLVLNRSCMGTIEVPVAGIRALHGFSVAPVQQHEAQRIFDDGLVIVREAAHVNAYQSHYPAQPRVRQSYKSRLARAWEVFRKPHQ